MAKTQNRVKLFIENFFAYGFINVLNKIIPLLLLPVVTRMLTDTADYGKFDMFNTLVGFGSSIVMLGMYDAMFREYFEKDDPMYQKSVCSVALRIVLASSFGMLLIMVFFSRYFSLVFFGDFNSKSIVVLASIGMVLAAWKSIISAPTRFQNKRKVYVVSGLLSSTFYYAISIALIFNGFGAFGLIYSNLISSFLILLFFIVLNWKHFDISIKNKPIRKELFKIGLPLMPTFLIYWVFHSMDRIMIANMLDLSQVGIYSIGARVASISQIVYMAFAGGWQYFAFSTMNDEDQVAMTSKIFEYLGIVSFVAFLGMTFVDDFVFQLLFTGDYTKGVLVFPFLFLAPLLQMLFQIGANQFLVIKDTKIVTISLIIGALSNVVLNYLLIRKFGIIGCALATLAGYYITVIIIMIITAKRKVLVFSKKFILLFSLLMVLCLLMFFGMYNNYISVIALTGIGLLYYQEVRSILKLKK